MLESWFECKVTYERPGEKGANTKVNESYLMKDLTFSSVEKRLTIGAPGIEAMKQVIQISKEDLEQDCYK